MTNRAAIHNFMAALNFIFSKFIKRLNERGS